MLTTAVSWSTRILGFTRSMALNEHMKNSSSSTRLSLIIGMDTERDVVDPSNDSNICCAM